MGKTVPEVLDTAVHKTEGTVFPNTDRNHMQSCEKRESKKDWVSGKAVALYGEKYLRHMLPDILT